MEVLKVFLNLTSDVVHKCNKFFKTFSEKDLKFILYEEGSPVLFDKSLILLPIEVNAIPKEQSYKKDVFVALSFSNFKMVLVLLIKIITFHM